MQGIQVTIDTEQNRRHSRQLVRQWLMELARSPGIRAVATSTGALGAGRDGKLHCAPFIALGDQPVALTMAPSAAQCTLLCDRLALEHANPFCVKTPVAFGVIGDASAH